MSDKIVLPPQFHLGCELRSEHPQCSHVCFSKHDASAELAVQPAEKLVAQKSEIKVLPTVGD